MNKRNQLTADGQRLATLIRAGHSCVLISTAEEGHTLDLVRHVAMDRDQSFWIWSVVHGVRSGIFEDATPVKETEHPAAALYHFANQLNEQSICVMLDLLDHLEDARTLRALRETISRFAETGSSLILIDHRNEAPPAVRADLTPFEVSLPDEKELERIARSALTALNRSNEAYKLKITKSEFRTIVRNLRGLNRRQARQVIIDSVYDDMAFNAADINTVLAHKRHRLHLDGLLEYVEAPVTLDDVGGLNALKDWLRKRRRAFDVDWKKHGLSQPRGVLLLGVQGAGKSLAAKAIATAWEQPLLRLDPGSLYDRYIGESERRLRSSLQQAEAMSPIVLWIDEIEKGFASAASHSTDGGLSQRMFGTLLTWMQEHEAPVFLVATANNIDALPPELLRKGRFDEVFFVDLPGPEVRRLIFTIHLRKRNQKPDAFELDELVAASDGYSGAEIEHAIISALYDAFEQGKPLRTSHVFDALRRSPPLSVTRAEHVEMLRNWARERCVAAD